MYAHEVKTGDLIRTDTGEDFVRYIGKLHGKYRFETESGGIFTYWASDNVTPREAVTIR